MIQPISKSSRNPEVSTVCSNISTVFHQSAITSDEFLTSLFVTIDEKLATLLSAIKRMKEKSQLMELDTLRDDAFRAVWYMVYGYTFHPDGAISMAAKRVFVIMENFGLKLIKETYSVESAHIDSMLVQLANTEILPSINALSGVPELIAALKTAETNFENIRIEFESKKGNEGTFVNASSLSKELIEIFNEQLIVYVNAKLISKETAYEPFAITVAQLITDSNSNVKRRSKRKASAAEEVAAE